jgi:hypothetical protein
MSQKIPNLPQNVGASCVRYLATLAVANTSASNKLRSQLISFLRPGNVFINRDLLGYKQIILGVPPLKEGWETLI